MKKILSFFVGVLVAFGFANAADIRVGLAANYPPFEFINDQNKITGFDLDLLEEISKKAGFTYEIVNMSFDGLIPALKSGKLDAIMSAMSATDERRKAVDFTDPYFHTKNVYIKQAKNTNLKSKDDLNGKKVGVQLGTVQEMAVQKIPGVKITANSETYSVVMALKSGKIDALCFDDLVGAEYLKKNSDLVAFFNEPDGSEGFSIAFDKNKQTNLIKKINQALKDIKKDGSYDKILEKYGLK